jgi:hypothetical protein
MSRGGCGLCISDNIDAMAELPIVCTLGPDALSARRQGLLSELLQQAKGRELLPDGLALTRVDSAFAGRAYAATAASTSRHRLSGSGSWKVRSRRGPMCWAQRSQSSECR